MRQKQFVKKKKKCWKNF